MKTSRRGFFGILGAAAIAPALPSLPEVKDAEKVITRYTWRGQEVFKKPITLQGGHFRGVFADGGDLGRGSGPAFRPGFFLKDGTEVPFNEVKDNQLSRVERV